MQNGRRPHILSHIMRARTGATCGRRDGQRAVQRNNPDYVPGITEDTGYDFIGWSSDGGTTLLDADGVKAIAVTGNITYTAYYEKEEYTVTYDAGAHGALVGGATDSVLYNEYPDYGTGYYRGHGI